MPEKTELELISIHVPKSGGTSFRNILQDVYGEHGVARFDMPRRKNQSPVLVNKEPWEKQVLPKNTRVLHGHFSYDQLTSRFDIDQAIPVITWLRHPVDRVISHYYYLQEQLRGLLGDNPDGLGLLEKLRKNLLEFAQDERNRNRTSKFLQGMNLQQFKFVGLMEHYQEDLDDLGVILNWEKTLPVVHSNRTKIKRDTHDALRALIAELNERDMDLYTQALELRSKRLDQSNAGRVPGDERREI